LLLQDPLPKKITVSTLPIASQPASVVPTSRQQQLDNRDPHPVWSAVLQPGKADSTSTATFLGSTQLIPVDAVSTYTSHFPPNSETYTTLTDCKLGRFTNGPRRSRLQKQVPIRKPNGEVIHRHCGRGETAGLQASHNDDHPRRMRRTRARTTAPGPVLGRVYNEIEDKGSPLRRQDITVSAIST